MAAVSINLPQGWKLLRSSRTPDDMITVTVERLSDGRRIDIADRAEYIDSAVKSSLLSISDE